MPPQRIYLIGMPASGKTTFGKRLAKALAYPFFDLDWEIEKKEGMSIPDIFSQYGEEYFRILEREAVREITPSPAIIATGGGAPCFYDNMEWLTKLGYVIFLDVPVDLLAERAWKRLGSRPLLNQTSLEDMKLAIAQKRAKRLPFYQKAHRTLSIEDIQKIRGQKSLAEWLDY